MTKPKIKIYDLETGDIVEREMTQEESDLHFAEIAEFEAEKLKQASKNAARQAVLDKLGLSADEVAALLG